MGIGERLREERKRLELDYANQTEFAEAAGVKKNAQSNYENNIRVPDADYLAGIASMGCDVLYILTGQRTAQPVEPISVRESRMLENYRALDEEDKAAMQRMTHALAQSVKPNGESA